MFLFCWETTTGWRVWAEIWKLKSVSMWGLSRSRDKTEANCEIWKHSQISPVSKWTLRSVWSVTSTSSLHGSLVCASLYVLFCAILPAHIFSTFLFKEIRVYEMIILLYQAQSAKILQKWKVSLVTFKLTFFFFFNIFVLGNKKTKLHKENLKC